MKKQIREKILVIIIVSMLLVIICSSIGVAKKEDNTEIQTKIQSIRSLFHQFFSKQGKIASSSSFFSSTIQTRCGDVEKTSTITFGLNNEIDVDNNAGTGVNGKDIRIQYVLLPWITLNPEFSIGAIFSLHIERIGSEIKNKPFSLSSSISDGILRLGYRNPLTFETQIPRDMQLSAYVFIKPESNTKGITFYMNPEYDDDQQHEVTLFSSYADDNETKQYDFSFFPATEKQITIESTRSDNILQYSFTKDVGVSTIATANIQKIKNNEIIHTNVTIDPLPSDISFSLGLTPFSQGGGIIEYESNAMYETTVIVESNTIGICKYALIENMPKSLSVEWDPAKTNGYYKIDVDTQGTDISLLDSLDNPTINLSIHGIEDVAFTAFWNFTNPGDFTVIKSQSFHIDLDFIIDVWEARIDAEPTAENIKITWLTDISGYLSYDTNWQPIQQVDLLIKGSDIGIRTIGEFFKAEDFFLEWTIWPPLEWNINTSGEIEFSSIIIEVFIEGSWYRIWPW